MINDKQFILGKEPYKALDWKNLCLSNGLVLSYQEKLNVWTNELRTAIILGNVWQVDPERQSPKDEISQLVKGDFIVEDVFALEKTWCGRYLLIIKDCVFMDAIGSLGVFYSENNITSSLNVLCEVEKRSVVYPDIKHGLGPDFVPGMRTCYQDVKRLLPSQIYNLVTREVQVRPLLPDGIVAANSDKDRVDLLERYFVCSLQNMEKLFSGKEIWLALTGGRDSRAAMVFLEKAGIEYKTCTLGYPNINPADIDLPKRLSRKARKKHVFIKREEANYSRERYEDYRIHSAGMAVDQDWNFYTYNQYQTLAGKSEIVILRSSIWENVNDYYSHYCVDGNLDFEKVFPAIKVNDFLSECLHEWYVYVQHDIVNGNAISIWNRMLWELRTGCWLSSIEQSFDMMEEIISIQPCNCRLFLSILAGFDQKDRVEKKHEEFIVKRVCPKLYEIPYDYQYVPKITMIKRVRKKLGKIYRSFVHG